MDRQEAENYADQKVKIILSNGFHFTGKVISVSDDALVIFDKFNSRVTLKLSDIMVCSGVSNGY